jgi:hypothetical protein
MHGVLHKASTKEIDEKVRKCATDLQDSVLLAKLSPGDMVAIDAIYHNACLAQLYRRWDKLHANTVDISSRTLYAAAFAELVCYIESFRDEPETAPFFPIPQLCRLYAKCLEELGVANPEIHSTRLRERLENAVPDLISVLHGREYVLMYNRDLGCAVSKACKEDGDMFHLVKAAQLVRKELSATKYRFDGTFPVDQDSTVPPILRMLVKLIINGPQSMTATGETATEPQAVTTISQLLAFNIKSYNSSTKTKGQGRSREPPVPVYLGLKVHSLTRSQDIVNILHKSGLGISYKRVLAISTDIANSVLKMYDTNGVVVPPQLSKSSFTTGVVDNVDINPSSTTAMDSFDGTSISLIQHGSGSDITHISVFDESVMGKTHVAQLPLHYTHVEPIAFAANDLMVPHCALDQLCAVPPSAAKHVTQHNWLEQCRLFTSVHDSDIVTEVSDAPTSWAAFHSQQHMSVQPLSKVALLPLLHDNAHTAAMIRHAMGIVDAAIKYLNPGQTPVIAMDQPLFALAKKIQWRLPGTYGEDKFVVLMGGLHIEMAALKVLGHWLEGSGWTSVLVASGVATSGRAESFLKSSHITTTRYAHQVTAAALFILKHRAYSKYASSHEAPLAFEEWCTATNKKQPQFAYWSLVLELELAVLELIHSNRTADFRK